MKTARFKQVVARSGRPSLHLAWSKPATDRVLQSAVKQHRVLTIHQQTRGNRKDHGTVGLDPGPHAQYLVFPKSLRKFSDRRIVGIQYELLQGEVSSGGRLSAPAKRAKITARNVVPFEPPAPTPRSPKRVRQPAQRIRPEPVEEPAETDPVKREIRLALDDLKDGHVQKARRRLAALLTRDHAAGW